MQYVRKTDGMHAELVNQDSKTSTVALKLENGTTQRISTGTLKRWWKKVEDVVSEETESVEEVKQKPTPKPEVKSEVKPVVKKEKKSVIKKADKLELSKNEVYSKLVSEDLALEFKSLASKPRDIFVNKDGKCVAVIVCASDYYKVLHAKSSEDSVESAYLKYYKNLSYMTQVKSYESIINVLKSIKED